MAARWSPFALLAALLLSACGSDASRPGGTPGTSAVLECAPFARQVSGIQLFGEAYSWWDQAAGQYGRGPDPVAGGVLVFRRSGRLPSGHVSVVGDLVSAREIRVTQANWVHRRITRNEPVVDVSPTNNWSQVRVWWELSRSMGSSTYATYGFIAPPIATPRGALAGDLVAGLDVR